MQNTKENILKTIIPKAVLLPLTKEATNSIVKSQCKNDLIPMFTFPYRFGRESRLGNNERGIFLKLRIISTKAEPNNDIYLLNESKNLQISKEHFQIERNKNFFILKDRGSTMGTTINGVTYGQNNGDTEQVLNDGDIIKIGNNSSEFKYQFVILENEKI